MFTVPERENSNEHKTLSYRADIDGLRALAVLLVVGYHAFPNSIKAGFIGVDIFFVISGYLIGGIILINLQANEFSYRNFYFRRIIRIFPALILIFLGVLIAGYICLLPDELKNLGLSVFTGGFFGENFLLWKSAGYFDTVAHAKPLLNLWSLGIEEQFYIIFPLLLSFCWKKKLRVFSILAILALMSLTDCIWLRAIDSTADFYSPLTRFWELFIGCMLKTVEMSPTHAIVREKINKIFCKIFYRETTYSQDGFGLFLAFLGILVLLLALIRISQESWYPGWLALFPVCGALCLIGAGQTNFISHYFFSNKIAVYIGKISYPLYLWHWPLLSFAWIINGHLDSSTRILRIGLIFIAFLLAIMTYLFVERPIRLKCCFGRASVPILISLMFFCCCAGLWIYCSHGLPERAKMREYSDVLRALSYQGGVNEEGLKYTGLMKDDFDFCLYNDVGEEETIALFGDSHANAAYPGIANLGKQLSTEKKGTGFNTLCLADRAQKLFEKEGLTYVERLNKFVDTVSKHPEIKKIFLITRGMLPITGIDNRMSGLKRFEGLGKEKFINLYETSINALQQMGKDVVVVAENPELNYDIRSAINRGINGLSINYERLKLLKKDVLEWEEQYLDALKSLEKNPLLEVLYTNEIFCPGEECIAIDEYKLPLYHDDDHLSIHGSNFQAQRLIKPWLEKKALAIPY